MSQKIYIGNLPYSVSQDNIYDMFESYGQVQSVNLITDRETGRAKGFGFVEMANEEDAENAISELHEKPMDGRNIIVNKARPQEKRNFRNNNRY